MRRRLLTNGLAVLLLVIATQSPEAGADSAFDSGLYIGKVVLVDFWASWCEPCARSFPWMNDMQEKYSSDGLVIVAVNVDNDREAAQRFLDEYPAKFQIHFDDDKEVAREYEIVAMPSSFLIGRDGKLVAQHLGFKVLQQDDYEAALRLALGRSE
jgi:thiol-disulfide isomerase/thioredoxin